MYRILHLYRQLTGNDYWLLNLLIKSVLAVSKYRNDVVNVINEVIKVTDVKNKTIYDDLHPIIAILNVH